MTTNQIIGVVALAFGALGAFAYAMRALGRGSRLLSKLEPMQARWGKVPGTVVHFTAYVLLPLLLGVILFLAGG